MSRALPNLADIEAKRPPRPSPSDRSDHVRAFHSLTEWEYWQHDNCDRCAHYDPTRSVAESPCGLEVWFCAAYYGYGEVPAVAVEMFGVQYDENGRRGACRYRRDRGPEHPTPRPKPIDPLQLVLIADPTEPIAGVEPVVRQMAESP